MRGSPARWIVAKRREGARHCVSHVFPHSSSTIGVPRTVNRIFINDLRIETRIGVYEWEQHLAQPLLLNLEFELPSAQVFSSDRFEDALDYTAVVKRLQALAADHTHKMLERFAEAIAEILCREFGAPWASVRVCKLAPLAGVKQIGVAIERGTRLQAGTGREQ
jgi:7,8-dihydroneopterin aldolase/epimerase/oxygenase